MPPSSWCKNWLTLICSAMKLYNVVEMCVKWFDYYNQMSNAFLCHTCKNRFLLLYFVTLQEYTEQCDVKSHAFSVCSKFNDYLTCHKNLPDIIHPPSCPLNRTVRFYDLIFNPLHALVSDEYISLSALFWFLMVCVMFLCVQQVSLLWRWRCRLSRPPWRRETLSSGWRRKVSAWSVCQLTSLMMLYVFRAVQQRSFWLSTDMRLIVFLCHLWV